MVSNDVEALDLGGVCDALLLTPKARVIAPLRVWRRGPDDFLLLTESGLGAAVLGALRRARFAAKVELEPEQHESWLVLDDPDGGLPTDDYGVPAAEVLDTTPAGTAIDADELERLRIAALTPSWGRELDDRVLPAEAGLVERAVSLTKGCYPGQEPIARQHYRGRVNRTLRVLELAALEPPPYDAELRRGDRVVGRVTSAVRDDGRVLALGYVRTEVPDDAELEVAGSPARLIGR
jgi:tRNA-modifying protein YgfZ